MKNDAAFSETEDTKLKQFLTGGRVYSQLAVAIVSALVFVLTMAGIVGIYKNCRESENLQNLTGLNVSGNLDGQYISGSAYKFFAKLGYIAQSEAAATHYYYFMYLDAADGEQYVTLVQAPKEMDESVQSVITGFLAYVDNHDGAYNGAAFSGLTGRFKNMSSQEKEMTTDALRKLGLTHERTIGYTLKLMELPKPTDTVGYWFLAVPFGIAMVVSIILFIYGLILEDKRAEAQKSPYPYQNRKQK